MESSSIASLSTGVYIHLFITCHSLWMLVYKQNEFSSSLDPFLVIDAPHFFDIASSILSSNKSVSTFITRRTHYRAALVTFVISEDNQNFEIFSLLVTKIRYPSLQLQTTLHTTEILHVQKATILTESINLNRLTQKSRLAEPNLSSLVIQFNSLGQSTDWFGVIRGCLFDLTNSPEWKGWFMNYLLNLFVKCCFFVHSNVYF